MIKFLLLYFVLATNLCYSCGADRWTIKVGSDQDVSLVNISNVIDTTLNTLVSIPKPKQLPATRRILPYEANVYRLTATLIDVKGEDDGDFHLVLRVGNQTMIVEIPDIDCVPAGGRFYTGVQNSLAAMHNYSKFTFAPVSVRVTGVLFFDVIHGQEGVAVNGVELHPVLNIEFLP